MIPKYAGGGDLSKYPHLFPPPGFMPLVRSNLITIPGGSVPGTQLPLEVITLPQGYVGWIRDMGLESGDWASVAFQFLINNQPMRDFTLIQVPIGSPSTPASVFIAVPPNVVVQLQVVVLAVPGAPVPVRWYLGGWYYQGENR